MTEDEQYQIHDWVSVHIKSRAQHVHDGYKYYMRHFETCDSRMLEKTYYVRDISEFRLGSEHRTDGPYIGIPYGFFIPKERYAVTFRDGKIEEYTTYANRATNVWLQTLLIPQGVSLVHGAGVSFSGKGVVLAGFGGVGKTLLVSAMRDEDGFQFFGDDYVFVTSTGTMHAYPTDFSVYHYHLAAFSKLHRTQYSRYLLRRRLLAPYYVGKQAVNFVVRRCTNHVQPIFTGWNAPYVKVPASFLIPQERIGKSVSIAACVFLTRHAHTKVTFTELSVQDLVAMLTGNLRLEMQHALPYLDVLTAYGLFDSVAFIQEQNRILTDCVQNIRRFRLSLPLDADIHALAPSLIQQIKEVL